MKKILFTLTMLLFSIVLFSQESRSTVLNYWKQRVVPPYAQDSTTWASFWNMADDGIPVVYPDSVASSVIALDTIVIKDTSGVFRKAAISELPGSSSYIKYVANVTQTGTSIPTAVVGANDLGTITYNRSGAGIYTIVSASNSFTSAKTFVLTSGALGFVKAEWVSTSTISLRTYAGVGGGASDLVLDNTAITILVTP